ncbi:MAG: NADH-quinone oxidoreductase subunit K [Caldilineales bacterium]|nr:NADH-quinone oxidoreductase subunit K [Caldilineales bacterium]
MQLLTALAIGALFGIGLFQIMRQNILRSAMGLFLISNAINLFLLSTGAYDGLVTAYTTASGQRSDALPQALVLTAIVISMGGLAFVLSLLYIISVRYKTSDMDEIDSLRN